MHVHVYCAEGEAKFWLAPEIVLVKSCRLTQQQLSEVRKIIEDHKEEIVRAWQVHFKR